MQEFYLSDNIVQGEEIPFYILWKGDEIKSLKLEITGFSKFIEIYNADDYELSSNSLFVSKTETPGYLGGLISTCISDVPQVSASMKVNLEYANGQKKEFFENRILYTTKIIPKSIPEIIDLSNPEYEKILIDLKGETSVFFKVNKLDENECEMDYLPEVKMLFLNIGEVIHSGLIDLKAEYPAYTDFIDYILEFDNSKTISTLSEEVEREIESKYSDAISDEIFLSTIADIFITAMLGNADFKKNILGSTYEYFKETRNTNRVFFNDPLLNIYSPKGLCNMALELVALDVLKQQSDTIKLKIMIEGEEEIFVPIVDLFSFRRVS
ncbi:hypothetical protein L1994_03480 [Methanomicrobium antiquum]|uniref:Uncharacterized protein n=1 Tax=Methanomicrobium antiquum TaxID=487686 RepID=A0AAF0FT47_9EURY|nr:hypothetical protein [Methanomicrobium antiquum]WFN37461.1 hypothetical protein L1994_03480 [Methanomicrobium antiquum]